MCFGVTRTALKHSINGSVKYITDHRDRESCLEVRSRIGWLSVGPRRGRARERAWLAQCLAWFNLARRDSHKGDGHGEVIKSNLLHASAAEMAMKITATGQGAHLVQIRLTSSPQGRDDTVTPKSSASPFPLIRLIGFQPGKRDRGRRKRVAWIW